MLKFNLNHVKKKSCANISVIDVFEIGEDHNTNVYVFVTLVVVIAETV